MLYTLYYVQEINKIRIRCVCWGHKLKEVWPQYSFVPVSMSTARHRRFIFLYGRTECTYELQSKSLGL